MSDPSVTPEPILQVCAGLWAAGALKSGVDLKLFDALAAGPQDVAVLSHTLSAAPQSLRVVLDALVALGLVARQAHGYSLTEVSSAFLVSSQPTYLGALVADNANSAAVFDVCKDYRRVVTEGYRLDPWAYSTGSNERVVHLTRNLFTLGYPAAQAIADHLGWTPGTPKALRLLEVGCGSAVYGVVALTRLPAARLTAQDWPVVLPVAQECAAQLGWRSGCRRSVAICARWNLAVPMMRCFSAIFSTIILKRPAVRSCESACGSWHQAGASLSLSFSRNLASRRAHFRGCLAS
jgi:hypothetical protein